jgi:excisionase family DNA binding protein
MVDHALNLPPARQKRTKITPTEVARRWGISRDKVLCWIRSGELRAMNAATRPRCRPRWLIDLADLAAFEQARAARPAPASPRRCRKTPGVIEYF